MILLCFKFYVIEYCNFTLDLTIVCLPFLPDPGCEKSPPAISNGYFNVSGDLSCWGYPEEGSNAEYHCEEGYQLLGTALYVCSQGAWIPEGVLVDDEAKLPICSKYFL